MGHWTDFDMQPELSTHELVRPSPSPTTDPDQEQPHTPATIFEKASSRSRPRHRFRGAPGRKQKFRKTLFPLLLRWSIILVLVAAMYAVLFIYTGREVMSRGDKRIFNALITGISIFLALMTISFLNGIVIELRWWMLSRRHRSRRKVQSILHAHSLRQAVTLAYSSRRISMHIFALSWVLLLVASQVGLASINLCFTLETNEATALMAPGNVSMPSLAIVETNDVVRSSRSTGAQQYTANSYGTISLAFSTGDLDNTPTPGTLFYQDDYLTFCDDLASTCAYIFHETNTDSALDPTRIPIKAATDRSVRVSAECRSYPVLRGGDGTSPSVTINLRNGAGSTQNVSIPIQAGADQSTYFTDTSDDACGSGCASITALEASATEQAWLYNCTVRVEPVRNADLPSQDLGPDLARMAAQGIALQGYASALSGVPGAAASTSNASGADLRMQAQVYPSETSWGSPVNGSTTLMGFIMARFAIGVVAIAAESNDEIITYGKTPHIGVRVKMDHWPVVHVILILTLVVQLLLGIGAAWVAHWVIVPPTGPVAEAQVLKAMMPGDETGGRLRRGDSGKRGGTYDGRKTVWIYRDEYVGGGVYDLFMEEAEIAVAVGPKKSLFWWLKREERRMSQGSVRSQDSESV